jgi:hypothetical protein
VLRSKRREWRSEIHAPQWRTTIDDYCEPILDKPVDAIDTQAVLGVLQPVWGRLPETASRQVVAIVFIVDVYYLHMHGILKLNIRMKTAHIPPMASTRQS